MTRAEVRLLIPVQSGSLLGPLGGTGMVTLVPAISDVFGVSVAGVALSITVYMVPFALVQVVSGAVAERLGGRRTALWGFGVYALGAVASSLAPGFAAFLAARLLQGIGAAFIFPVLMALVGEVIAPARLGRAIGAVGMTQTIGLTVGPALAGVLEVTLGWRWFFVALAGIATISGAAFAALVPRGVEARAPRGGVIPIMGRVLRERAVLLVSGAGAGLFFAMIGTYTYLTAWLKEAHDLAEDRIGVILAVAGAVGIPASVLAGRWVDRLGRKTVALGGLAAYAASTLGFWLLPYSFPIFCLVSALLGWAAAVAWTALNTLAVEAVPELRRASASIYNAFRFLGYAAAPPLLGLVYGRETVGVVYVACALVVLAAAGLIVALPYGATPLPAPAATPNA